MFGLFYRVFSWIISLWSNMSEDEKEKIINIIVASFSSLLKAFYHASKTEKEE